MPVHETRIHRFFGRTYKTRNTYCSRDGSTYEQMPEKLQLPLTICPSSYCDASCKFCIAKHTGRTETIDLKKLEYTLKSLKQEDAVRKIYIKGGEPFSDVSLLDDVLNMIFGIFGNDLYVSMTTNGNRLRNIYDLKALAHISKIHISRHHDDDRVNDRIFGRSMICADEIKEIAACVPDKDLFVYNCMLLKDHVSTTEDAHRFMDFAIATCVNKVAFMSCTPINEYAKDQFIHFSDVFKDSDPDILFTNGFCDHGFCQCVSGIYLSPKARTESFYARYTNTSGCDYMRGFVYETDNVLRSDFAGEAVFVEHP